MSCHRLGTQPVPPAHHTAFLRTPAVTSNGETERFSWNNWHKKGSHTMPFNLPQTEINQLARLCHQRSKARLRPKQAGGPDGQSEEMREAGRESDFSGDLVVVSLSTRPGQTGCAESYFGHTAANI